ANLAHKDLPSARTAATPLRETFRILADLIHWLACRDGVVGQEKASWPSSADRRGCASRILNPAPHPTNIFPRPPVTDEKTREKCSGSLSRSAGSMGRGHHTSTPTYLISAFRNP